MSFADRIRETVSFTGQKGVSDTITLPGSAASGYDPFSRRYNTGTANIPVVIAHRSQDEWQACYCTYSSANTLTVNSIIATSNNPDSAVNFSGGDKDVYVAYTSDLRFPNTGLKVLDSDASHALTLSTAGLTANRTLTFETGSASDFTLKLPITNTEVSATAAITSDKLSFLQAGTSAVARTVDSKLKDFVSVLDFGAKGDCRNFTGSATASSTTLTGTGFTSADVGKDVIVPGAGVAGATLSTTVTAVTNSTTLTMAVAASTSVSNKFCTIATDDTAEIQAAINSATNVNVYFPPGIYKISDVLTIGSGKIVRLVGAGPGISIINQTNLTKGGVDFDINDAQGGGLSGLTIRSDVPFGDRGSSGIGLRVNKCNDNFLCENFDVISFDIGVSVDRAFQPSFRRFRILFAELCGIRLKGYVTTGDNVEGTRWTDGKISNNGYNGPNTNSQGILIEQGSGEFFDTIDITIFSNAVWVAPPSTSWARFLFFKAVLADTSLKDGWVFESTNGKIFAVNCVDCWSSGSGGGTISGAQGGSGVVTVGSNISGIDWVGGKIRDNDNHGVELRAGGDIAFHGTQISCNSRRTGNDNTYHGVNVDANVSGWALIGCRIGNFARGVFNNIQAHGVNIASGASQNFRIIGCDLRDFGTNKSPIVNGSTQTAWIIKDNIPVQTPDVNVGGGQTISQNTQGDVATNTTVYSGAVGQTATEVDAYIMASMPGFANELRVEVNAAPGATQTFTYTLRRNDADTAITGTISGASSFAVTLTQAISISKFDRLTLKITTSNGAAAAKHRWYLRIDP